MPVLSESDDEIVIGRDWWLNWLFRPTRIALNREKGIVTWRWFFFPNNVGVEAIRLVEAVSKYYKGENKPFANDVTFILHDGTRQGTRQKVAGEATVEEVKNAAERLNKLVLGGEPPWRYNATTENRPIGPA